MRRGGASPGPTPTHEGFYLREPTGGGRYYVLVDKDGKVIVLTPSSPGASIVYVYQGQWATDSAAASQSIIEDWGSYGIENVEVIEGNKIFTYDDIEYTLNETAGTLSPDVTDIYPE